MAEGHPDPATLREALRSVLDPELGVSVVDLGLIYGIAVDDDGVRLTMTATSPTCPLNAWLVEQVRARLASELPEGTPVEVALVWEPPWSPERMSDAARRQLGLAAR